MEAPHFGGALFLNTPLIEQVANRVSVSPLESALVPFSPAQNRLPRPEAMPMISTIIMVE
jgi:hypothetical protein